MNKEAFSYTESAKVDKIKQFFNEFKDKNGNYKYLEKIDGLTGSNLMIEIYDLFDYEQESKSDFEIWEYFTKNPSEATRLAKRSIREVYSVRHGYEKAQFLDLNILLDKSEFEITVTQSIKHNHLNKLVSINCRIHGETQIQNKIINGFWLCSDGHQSEGNDAPPVCNNKSCKLRNLELDKEKSEIQSFRTFYVKDLEYTSHNLDSLIVQVTGDLIDSVKMGETVKFTGYVTLEERNKKLLNVFHALNVSKPDEIHLEITSEDIEYFKKLAKTPEHYDRLIDSIAPNIYNSKLLKQGFLLGYIGSPQWDSQQRNWINVLVVGDPATAKSKIAQWGSNNLENVKFVSSKAGSAKGLFAGQKEQTDGEKVLEVGPMVSLSGRGLLCIDEFARMRETFDIFYSPMDSGTFNSATVGGHENLNAATPIYATGNPHKSNVWDDDKSVVDNLQVFEPSMLSRFDLIIICKDENSSDDRKNIARSILGQHNDSKNNLKRYDILSTKILSKYCKYAKTINPVLTSDVIDEITETFDDVMKKKSITMKNNETNTRFVGTLARITLAIARIHLHHETTMEDFQKAHDLIKVMLAQRGLQASNANTYIERISQMIFTVLEESLSSLTDPEIYNLLFQKFSEKRDSLLNDVGQGGPLRRENKRWRIIMEHVEKSYMVEIESKTPRRIRWKHEEK